MLSDSFLLFKTVAVNVSSACKVSENVFLASRFKKNVDLSVLANDFLTHRRHGNVLGQIIRIKDINGYFASGNRNNSVRLTCDYAVVN